MPKSITIQRIAYDIPVGVDQIVTVSHKEATEPDTSFIVDTTTQMVYANGILNPELVIPNLDFDTRYTLRIANSCGDGSIAYLTLRTGINPCPDISRVFGTVY